MGMASARESDRSPGILTIQEEEYRFKVLWNQRLLLGYNKGYLQYGDFYKSKPDIHPVHSPSGRPLTTTGAHRYNHHRSLWIGHARVNGVNVFHDNNPQRPNLGHIVLESATPEVLDDGAAVALRTRNRWVRHDGPMLLTERRDVIVRAAQHAGHAHAIDLTSELVASAGPITLERDTHAYLGLRVADSMDEEDGGQLLNSNGQRGEAGCMGQVADWCDYSGEVAGAAVGVTIMHHPDNPPTAFFARAYGALFSNPTLLTERHIAAGDRLVQRWRILLHEGDARSFDPAAAYRGYLAVAPAQQ